MKVLRSISKFIWALGIVCSAQLVLGAQQWQNLEPGLEYVKIVRPESGPQSYVHAFRIDPSIFELGVSFASDSAQRNASVRQLAQQQGAVVAVNGGFFSPEYRVLGLRITRGKQRSPLKGTSWWGVFSIMGKRARIDPPQAYDAKSTPDMAIQSGPRLVINGWIPPLKNRMAERSAIGITRKGKIILLSTQSAAMHTTTLAELMRKDEASGGLDCDNALNLDGGRSAQLYSHIGRFKLHVPNISMITDAVVVKRR